MNVDINSVAITSSSSRLDLGFPYEIRMVETTTFNSNSASKRRHNPRKKRSRKEKASAAAVGVAVGSKAKYRKKRDPSAPKITPSCTECGREFFSDKALHGHMRCHPERQWRGINRPLHFRRPISVSPSTSSPIADLEESSITEEDQDIADCLIMLANGPNFIDRVSDCRFECSSCKKVFGSHQALGGHRASHKNVKGCFAMAKSDEETDYVALFRDCGHGRSINLEDKLSMILGTGHKCSICTRVFATGQALGGHKRCHWERVPEENAAATEEGCVHLDLNMPAPVEDGSSSSYSSSLTLDLRLGL